VICSGSLLLCSCYLGEQRIDDPLSFDPVRDSDLRAAWMREPSLHERGLAAPPGADEHEHSKVNSSDLHVHSLYRTRSGDPKQKVWRVFNTHVVLPEYLVEFDYVYSSEFVQSHLEERKPEYGHFARHARDFSFGMKTACAPTTGGGGRAEGRGEAGEEDDLASGSTGGCRDSAGAGGAAMRGRATSGGMGAVSKDRPQVECLNATSLLMTQNRILGSTEPEVLLNLKVLNLHGRGLRRLEAGALGALRSLETLLLSFNCVASLSSLPDCKTLTHLDLSFNLVEKVSSLGSLAGLRHLDMSWNNLGLTSEVCDVDAALRDVIRSLARDLPKLEVLDVTGNPMTLSQWYRPLALAQLPALRMLDEEELTAKEGQEARKQMARFDGSELSEAVLMEKAFMRTGYTPMIFRHERDPSAGIRRPASDLDGPESERNRIALLLGATSGAGGSSGSVARPTGLTNSNWRGYTERLDLRDLGFGELCRLSGFTHLRRVDLSGNRLTSLLKLTPCVSLEELAVERNLLATLEGAGDLPELRRLDAGSNRICAVLELKKLTKLSQLSLEDNLVDSLDTFAGLHSLVELYLSSNLIEELRSILLLKQLPKLLVLDLCGNELSASADSRLYTMFHLRRLKVLDGIPIAPAEQQEAEEKFSGKITMELLEDKLGPSPSCYNFRSVDLSGQNLRELGQLLNDDVFPSLRELSLNGNPFSDIRTMGPLSKLLVLKVNRTKLDLEKGMLADGDQVGGIASMPHLQVLEMGVSGITDMSFFAQFPLQTLRILHLPGNEITRLEGLSHMEQLRELVLDKNKVKQVDEGSFEGLRSLRELRMDDNGLKSLSNFGPLPRLRALHLSLNRVAEISELEKLRNLRHIVIINLAQNPVARKPLYRAHLINVVGSARAIDGKEVTDEERERVEQMLQGGSAAPTGGAGCYVFTEQQQMASQANVPSYMQPSLAGGGDAMQQKATYGSAGAQEGGQRRGDPSARGLGAAIGGGGGVQSHITVNGMPFGEGVPDAVEVARFGSVGGGVAGRRVSAVVGDVGGEAGGTGRRAPSYRAQSMPGRNAGLEYRPGAMPPGSGR